MKKKGEIYSNKIFINFVAIYMFKTIISIFLLFTYSLGFAHSIIPHCSGVSEAGEHTATHEHHEHGVTENHLDKHNHVTHNEHFDDGFIEFITCLIHEAESHETGCTVEASYTVNVNDVSFQDKSKLIASVVLLSLFQTELNNQLVLFSPLNVEEIYSSPPIKSTPLRGPPLLS